MQIIYVVKKQVGHKSDHLTTFYTREETAMREAMATVEEHKKLFKEGSEVASVFEGSYGGHDNHYIWGAIDAEGNYNSVQVHPQHVWEY